MIPGGLQIFLAVQPIDMRRSIDGLIVAVKERLERDAMTERGLYVFASAQEDRVKVLRRTRTSWCLLYARLDGHRVVLPSPIPTGATGPPFGVGQGRWRPGGQGPASSVPASAGRSSGMQASSSHRYPSGHGVSA